MFHPFEIAFCGFSGSGKTTLITKVIHTLCLKGYHAGYYKHGCHRFDIDRAGKDSFLARKAGAQSVMISDPEKQAIICSGSDPLSGNLALQTTDILLVEGLKELPIPKMLVIDADRAILNPFVQGAITNVVALVHNGDAGGLEKTGLPLFDRNDDTSVTAFIEEFFIKKATDYPVYGLVLAGGKSLRMGRDKALLHYHDKNQLVRTAELLAPHCRKVFISCREDQLAEYQPFEIPIITDSYTGIGPMGALLSAQRAYPDTAWFVAACDLPFLDCETVNTIATKRNPFLFATAYRDERSGYPEPLCSIYEPKSRMRLLLQHAEGNNSLCSFLQSSAIALLSQKKPGALLNVNDETGMEIARLSLHSGKPCDS
jgi:molybdopterin-guanine dinucleotide biosynthesis protein MobB